jgi:P pilus assembly chaperone PapD
MSRVMIALVAWGLLCTLTAAALAGESSLAVSPLKFEIQVEPGRAYTDSIEITNLGSEPEQIRVYCQDWTLKPDGVVVFVEAGRLPGSASKWVEVAPTQFPLAPGESGRVRFTVRPPAGAAGEARTVVILEAGAQALTKPGAPSSVIPRVGTILYLQSGPASPPAARVTQFQLSPDGGSVVVENVGLAHLRFAGQLEVRAGSRLLRARQLDGFVVLPPPFNLRRLAIQPEVVAGLDPGSYQATVILDCGGPALLGARTELVVPAAGPVVVADQK